SFQQAIDPQGAPSDEVLLLGLLCATAAGADPSASGGPLDEALLQGRTAPSGYHRLDQLPFDHERRLMSALVEARDGKKILITKGAPESLLPICSSVPASAQTTVNKLFASGARVIAVGSRSWVGGVTCAQSDEREITLAGFISFEDKP